MLPCQETPGDMSAHQETSQHIYSMKLLRGYERITDEHRVVSSQGSPLLQIAFKRSALG